MRAEEILDKNLRNLEKQLNRASNSTIKVIIVLLHFVPLREFILVKNNEDDFWNAYLGSDKLGELVLRYNKVKYVYFGHVDPRYLTRREIVVKGIRFINVDVSNGIGNIYILDI